MKFQESSWPFSCGIFSWLPCQTLLQRAGATCGHSDWLAGGFGRSPHHTQKGSHKCTLCSWRWNSRQCGDCCWELEDMKNSINITLNNHRKQQKNNDKNHFLHLWWATRNSHWQSSFLLHLSHSQVVPSKPACGPCSPLPGTKATWPTGERPGWRRQGGGRPSLALPERWKGKEQGGNRLVS